ncbi:MAG: response regulator transcription factor [Faecalicatena sp.]|uniref:response regulator transcription factor n=1 Tax=Faecalicatena sp. TaxID=2005360 RepID=UPI00258EC0AC|nr:response regulator transcription factor [Faecalicatena sp.]MCI6467231.1 response regulator transcription factor [Faecalicatena sp.]MDY5620236.1 response regulator transcription factor [Lachnospiraceae bacterium]
MTKRILAVDDEPGILQLLKDYFEIQGYEVIEASNGTQVFEKLSQKPDLILLDVNLPGIDGFEVCKMIRDHVSCPILFLTAKVEEADRIRGFHLGGDDYILKPFSIDELGARVEAHLRREERKNEKKAVKIQGPLAIHYDERSVYYNGRPISFTRTEFNIVELLSSNSGQVFSKDQVYDRVRGYDGSGDSSIVTEHIRRIRLKLSSFTEKPYIETVWGVGYKWIG